MTELPSDPFIPEEVMAFGKAASSIFASLIQNGLPENVALELTKAVLVAMVTDSLRKS